MKTYCVKQRKQTECVPGSETYVSTKNGRSMMKCKCAECGITKTKFVKGTAGKGLTKTNKRGASFSTDGSIIAKQGAI